jgi:hypothetical protein
MTEPQTEAHPYNYPWRQRFPDAIRIVGTEGGAVYAAEAEDGWWVITDQGTMAAYVDTDEDADLLASMVKLTRFEDEPAWRAECEAVRARFAAARREGRG